MTRKEFLRYIAEAHLVLDPRAEPQPPAEEGAAEQPPDQKSNPADSDSVR